MSSLERMLGVLDAFSLERPVWTVDGLATALGYTRSTSYRYVKELVEAGLLARAGDGAYMLGPRIVELDRQIRLCDPLLAAGAPVMRALLERCGDEAILLCSLYRDGVLCVHQERRSFGADISYARGRPMPLFRGATSRIMLAFLPERQLTRLFAAHRAEIADAGLGAAWPDFAAALRRIRRDGVCITHGEVNEGLVGIAAPILDAGGRVLGSLTRVMVEADWREDEAAAIAAPVAAAAQEIASRIARMAAEAGADVAAAMPQKTLGRKPQEAA